LAAWRVQPHIRPHFVTDLAPTAQTTRATGHGCIRWEITPITSRRRWLGVLRPRLKRSNIGSGSRRSVVTAALARATTKIDLVACHRARRGGLQRPLALNHSTVLHGVCCSCWPWPSALRIRIGIVREGPVGPPSLGDGERDPGRSLGNRGRVIAAGSWRDWSRRLPCHILAFSPHADPARLGR